MLNNKQNIYEVGLPSGLLSSGKMLLVAKSVRLTR